MPPMTTSPSYSSQTRLILIGAAVMLSLGMGLRQSFGLFLTPITQDLALTAADFTLAIAVQNIVWGISQAPIGAIADRFGLRATMMAGAAIYVIGLAVMAAAQGTPALIISGVLIGVALSCVASSLAMTAVARAVSGAPEPDIGHGRRRRIARYAADPARHAGFTSPPSLANRGAVLPRSRGGNAAGGLRGRGSRSDAATRPGQDDDARSARAGRASPPLSRD